MPQVVPHFVISNQPQSILQVSPLKLLTSKHRFSSEYHHCYGEADISQATILVSDFDQSCDETCAAEGLSCSEAMLKQMNTCSALFPYVACTQCTKETESFAPAFNPVNECIVASMQMLLNCTNKSPAHQRICPCLAPIQ
jgi:hypothetical protein